MRRRMAADQLGQHRQLAAGDLDAGRLGAGLQAPARSRASALGVGLLDGEVVEQRDRLGADADDVVDVHRDAVDADGLEPAGLLGDDELRADAVGRQRDAEVGRHRAARRRSGPGSGTTRDGRPGSIVRSTSTSAPTRAVGRRGVDAGGGVGVAHRAPIAAGRRRTHRARERDAVGRERPAASGRARPRTSARRAERRRERRGRAGGERRGAAAAAGRAGPAATPFSTVAPAITGSARAARARSRRRGRSRAAARRRASCPLRDTPGTSARACASAEPSASASPASSRARALAPARGRPAPARPRRRPAPAASDRGPPRPLLDRPLEGEPGDGRRHEGAGAAARAGGGRAAAAPRPPRGAARRAAPAAVPACSATSKRLAQLAVELGVGPAQQPAGRAPSGRRTRRAAARRARAAARARRRGGAGARQRSAHRARARLAGAARAGRGARRGRRSPTTISATTA